eukprot:172089_1
MVSRSKKRRRAAVIRVSDDESMEENKKDDNTEDKSDGDDDFVVDDQEDEKAGPSQSQRAMSEEEEKRIVGNLCREFLFRHSTKEPVTQKMLNEKVFQYSGNLSYREKERLKNLAMEKLNTLFGYELVSLSEVFLRQASTAQKRDRRRPAKQYILKSAPCARPEAIAESNIANEAGAPDRAFILFVLGLILANGNGGMISEHTLWRYLDTVGLNKDLKFHEQFGDMKEQIKLLLKQKYIRQENLKVSRGGGEEAAVKKFYLRGPRADLECSEADVFEAMHAVMGEPVDQTMLKTLQDRQEEEMARNTQRERESQRR